MDRITAIDKRISRRVYLTEPIPPEKLEKLMSCIAEINQVSGLSFTWLSDGSKAFERGKDYGMFKGVKGMFVLKGRKEIEHLKEKVGYYGEQLVLEATSLELGTCWVGGTFDKEAKEFGVDESEELVCVIPVGNAPKDCTIKEKMIRSGVRRKVKTVEEMIHSDVPLTDELRAAMELVQKAPTARNSQKVLFTVENGRIRASVPDDYQFDLVDLGICKFHFECGMDGGKFEWGNPATL